MTTPGRLRKTVNPVFPGSLIGLPGNAINLKIHFQRKLHFARVTNLVAEIIGAELIHAVKRTGGAEYDLDAFLLQGVDR